MQAAHVADIPVQDPISADLSLSVGVGADAVSVPVVVVELILKTCRGSWRIMFVKEEDGDDNFEYLGK
jgi:hypothetical protein